MNNFFWGKAKKLDTLNRVEIHSEIIRNNIRVLQKAAHNKTMFPVLKSNAYGHGLPQIVEIIKQFDFPSIAVDSYSEALEIWKVQKRPVLVMGPSIPNNIRQYKWKYLSLCVSNIEVLKAVSEMKKRVRTHLFVNTGMNREGLQKEEIFEAFEILKRSPKIELEGVCSHFADADGETEVFNREQEKRFSEYLDLVFQEGFSPKYIHLGNSAGCSKTSDKRINAFRPGIALYGYNPLLLVDPNSSKLSGLKPALELVSTITNIQSLKKGDTVGYNRTFTAEREMCVGVVPVGYFEALDRKLSSTGFLKYNNTFLPILGRVCMNLTCFSLGKTEAKIGDKITIISKNPSDKNNVENIAKQVGTIPYEVCTRVEQGIRREII
jgi:alanine racemase